MADLIAEPGLGMDIGVIALLMARMALMTLLRGMETTLTDLPSDWVLFGNRAEWAFQKPLESMFIDIPKWSDCPICNYDAYVRQQLDMSAQTAADAAQELLSELPRVDSLLPDRLSGSEAKK
jgi:hypothetical protein